MTAPWQRRADRVVRRCRVSLGERLIGGYVHGSAALGGWRPGSDLDLLLVVGLDLHPRVGHAPIRIVGPDQDRLAH